MMRLTYGDAVKTAAGTLNKKLIASTKTLPCRNSSRVSIPPAIPTPIKVGSQRLRVVVPERSNITAIENLKSVHQTTTGQLNLKYPSQWQGFLYGETKAGWIQVKGHFDEIKRGSKGVVGQLVKAIRGKGASEIDFRTTVGSAQLTFGRD